MSNTIELSKHKQISADDVDEVRSILAGLIQQGMSVRAMATESGVPYGTLIAFIKGTYNGRNDNVAERIRPFIAGQAAKARTKRILVSAPGFILTPSAEKLMDLFEFAQHAPDIGLGTGVPGTGKTETVKAYADGNPNVFVITATPAMRTTRQLLAELADVCNLSVKGRSSGAALSTSLIRRLRGTAGLIIVEEAQHLTTEAIDQLRALHDLADIGIALVGNNAVKVRLEGTGRTEDFAQLFSRIGMRVNLKRPLKRDISMILDAWDLKDEHVRKIAEEVARKPGALRGLTKTLRIAFMAAKRANLSSPTEKQIVEAWNSISDQRSAS